MIPARAFLRRMGNAAAARTFVRVPGHPDTLVRSEAPVDRDLPSSKMKVLWVGRRPHLCLLIHWKKGHAASPHKPPRRRPCLCVSGKLQVRDGTLNAGDYVYEPSGILHDATDALEDTTYLSSATAPSFLGRERLHPLPQFGKWSKRCALRRRFAPTCRGE